MSETTSGEPDTVGAPESPGVPCIACGYELRGLPRSGRCPECRTPVNRSVQGDALAKASPAYLRTLARGARWALLAGAAGPFYAAWPVMIPGLLVWTLACLWLAAPEGGSARSLHHPVRRLLRGLTGLNLLCGLPVICWCGLIFGLGVTPAGWSFERAEAFGIVAAIIAASVFTLQLIATAWWAGLLARRLPDPGAVKLAGFVGAGAPILVLTGVLFILLGAVLTHATLAPPICFVIPFWFGFLACWYGGMVLLFARLRRQLRGLFAQAFGGGGAAGERPLAEGQEPDGGPRSVVIARTPGKYGDGRDPRGLL